MGLNVLTSKKAHRKKQINSRLKSSNVKCLVLMLNIQMIVLF
jgi:hypothetical protein